METESLALRTARSHVENYNSESDLIAQHREAMDCRNCEAFLQLGIDAFDWLDRAVSDAKEAFREGRAHPTKEFWEAVDYLHRRWLAPVPFANEWIELQHQRQYAIDSLRKFRAVEKPVRATVAESDRMAAIERRADAIENLDSLVIQSPDGIAK